jgi:hypothetical protein
MPWHPLQAECDSRYLNLCGGLVDCVNDPLSRLIPYVLGGLQGRFTIAKDCRNFGTVLKAIRELAGDLEHHANSIEDTNELCCMN